MSFLGLGKGPGGLFGKAGPFGGLNTERLREILTTLPAALNGDVSTLAPFLQHQMQVAAQRAAGAKQEDRRGAEMEKPGAEGWNQPDVPAMGQDERWKPDDIGLSPYAPEANEDDALGDFKSPSNQHEPQGRGIGSLALDFGLPTKIKPQTGGELPSRKFEGLGSYRAPWNNRFVDSGMSKLIGRWGGGPLVRNLPNIISRAQFDQLLSGTPFRAPDGSVRRNR